MAISMLGLRVRAYDGNETPIDACTLAALGETYEALVNAPLASDAVNAALARADVHFFLEERWLHRTPLQIELLPKARTAILKENDFENKPWKLICSLLGLNQPNEPFPIGTLRSWRMFRGDRDETDSHSPDLQTASIPFDDSPWVLPAHRGWQPSNAYTQQSLLPPLGKTLITASMTAPHASFLMLSETFPGNQAMFSPDALVFTKEGAHLTASKVINIQRPYQSGAFASVHSFRHVRCEAEIKAAKGSGLVTGFFLHRDGPRQEIDIELLGNNPEYMLANVYFNPGDDGAAFGFGYRGTPSLINLGFDATADFHLYAIEWYPDRICWIVDGVLVQERASWDPTPIPHLPMRLHANLWIPESKELAGSLNEQALPKTATFRNIAVSGDFDSRLS